MRTAKHIFIVILGLSTLQMQPINFPSIGASMRSLATHMASYGKAVVNYLPSHKYISTAVLAVGIAGSLLAIPKTHHGIKNSIQSFLATACKKLGLQFKSPRLIRISARFGATYNDTDRFGDTCLPGAIGSGTREYDQALIDSGVDINAKLNYMGTCRLHWAAIIAMIGSKRDTESAQMLINAGAKINIQNVHGYTPLHFAALRNNINLVRIFVQAGAKVNLVNRQNETPTDIARERGNQEIVAYFNSIPRLQAKLQAVIQNQDFKAVQELIAQGAPIIDEGNDTAIHQAIGAYDSKNPTQLDEIARLLINTFRTQSSHCMRQKWTNTIAYHSYALQRTACWFTAQ